MTSCMCTARSQAGCVSHSSRRGHPSSRCTASFSCVAGPDNGATELVEEEVNGTVACSADPEVLAAAIVRVHDPGSELRRSTLDWFRRNREPLSLERSLETVLDEYRRG